MEKSGYTRSGMEWNERNRICFFAEYAAEVCVSCLEEFMRHAQIPEEYRHAYDEAVFALRFVLECDYDEDENGDGSDLSIETVARVLYGLHEFATVLPFLNADYMQVDDENYAQTSQLLAKRILPVLKDFADRTQSLPLYFCRIYTHKKEQCDRWDAVLQEMIFAFTCLAEPENLHRQDIKRMQVGLHLFAEYLQEMRD